MPEFSGPNDPYFGLPLWRRSGSVSLGQHILLAAEILGGRRVGIRVDGTTLTFFHLETRQLLRTRPNPLTPDEVIRLRGARPAGPPPQPAAGPTRVQRRASSSGVVMVVGQKIALGRVHAGKTVAIDVTDTTLTVDCDDDGPRTFRRTNDQPVRSIKAHRPRKIDHFRPVVDLSRGDGMDRFEGRCWLDWWANTSTLLGSIEVAVVITTNDAGWDAHGRLTSDADEERDGFAFLCDLDPVFTLRFEDESTVAVTVHPADDHRRFTLTEYTGPDRRSVDHRIDLKPAPRPSPSTMKPPNLP
ncbi:hypothetical protein AB0F73_11460 [Micromonospora purpureochromogenes]|uniref:hypothetical protein n=1 Tax=Micromonospora purpureochromogenes TaxID=47872 RepID=UPI0033CA5C27